MIQLRFNLILLKEKQVVFNANISIHDQFPPFSLYPAMREDEDGLICMLHIH